MKMDRRLVTAFGSEARVQLLAVLVHARGPLTAYRVAKVAGIAPSKAYRELPRLRKDGLASRRGNRWTASGHPSLAVLGTRVRVAWIEDWKRSVKEVDAIFKRLRALPHPTAPKGFVPRNPEEFRRSPYKDQWLRSLGLATSVHGVASISRRRTSPDEARRSPRVGRHG